MSFFLVTLQKFNVFLQLAFKARTEKRGKKKSTYQCVVKN